MSETNKRKRLETEAIVLGYAMSRLDRTYLTGRKVSTWEQASITNHEKLNDE
jgi:hypothetical protein